MRKYLFIVCVLLFLSVIGAGVYLASAPKTDDRVQGALQGLAAEHQRSATQPKESAANLLFRVERILHDFEVGRGSKFTDEQYMQMARDLNTAYYASRSEQLHKRISDALTRALNDEQDRTVARAIAFSHSRLPYDENFWPNLRVAYKRKVLTYDDYYGELAHGYTDAPEEVRKEMIKEIAAGHSRYAVDIIASQLSFAEKIPYSRQEITQLEQFFATNEPIFGGAEDAFGYFDAITYVNWLLAYARLQHAAGGVGIEQYWGQKLLDPNTDPRAAVSFLATGHAGNLSASQKAQMQWDAVQTRAQELVRKYRDAPVWQQVSKDMVKK